MKKMKLNVSNGMTFEDGFKEFITNCQARGLRSATINHYKESYKIIIAYVDSFTALEGINKATYDSFVVSLTQQNIRSQTIHSYSRDLKTIFNYFINEGYINSFKMLLPKVDKTPIQAYSDIELSKMLCKPNLKNCSFATYRTWVIINLILSSGLRTSSIINIKIKDLQMSEGILNINHTKSRRVLIVPLNTSILRILKEYLKHRGGSSEDYLFPNSFNQILNRKTLNGSINNYNRNLGIESTGTHKLRHSYAKLWIKSGGSLITLQKMLNHSSLAITELYINYLLTDLQREVNTIDIISQLNNSNKHIKINK